MYFWHTKYLDLFKVSRPFITLHTCKMICFHILKRVFINVIKIVVYCNSQRRMTGPCLSTVVTIIYLLFVIIFILNTDFGRGEIPLYRENQNHRLHIHGGLWPDPRDQLLGHESRSCHGRVCLFNPRTASEC